MASIEGLWLLDADAVKREENVFVDAFPYVGSRCLIKVKHREILRALRTYNKELRLHGRPRLQDLYRTVFTAAIDARVDDIYSKAQDGDVRQWQNFCDDIVILACLRQVLFNYQIRITPPTGAGPA